MDQHNSNISKCEECPLIPVIAERIAKRIDSHHEQTEAINRLYHNGTPINSGVYNHIQKTGNEALYMAKNIDAIFADTSKIFDCEGPKETILDTDAKLLERLCPISEFIIKKFEAH